MTRVAVVGAGQFGAQHARVYRELPDAELAGVYDADPARARAVAAQFGCRLLASLDEVAEQAQAASIAVPTREHAAVGCALLARGLDVLVEKPIASTLGDADRLIAAARDARRLLQVGHLERYNPAVVATQKIVSRPLFFEVHRLSLFTSRSLDVDVVLDLMIHDLDIVLTLVDSRLEEVRAVGLPVLSPRVDIANARLAFENGCVANFTASRVSTERVRKLRFFQPREYVSVDYSRQEAVVFSVQDGALQTSAEASRLAGTPCAAAGPGIGFRKLETQAEEPLRAELRDFLRSVATRAQPLVDGCAARRALETALAVAASIEEHARRLRLAPQAASP